MAAERPPLAKAHVQAERDVEWIDRTVGAFLRDAAQAVPDRLALVVPNVVDGTARQWTYRELLADSERVARALLQDFAPGDRVATWAGGSAEMALLFLGASLAGIVLVTLNPANRAGELEYLLRQGDARGLVLDRTWRGQDNQAAIEGLRSKLPSLKTLVYFDAWSAFLGRGSKDTALPQVNANGPALIVFTSGTTGKPKGAVLQHAGIVNNAALAAARIATPEGSVWLNVLPMFHVGGTVTMTLGAIANRGTQVLLAEFSADAMLDTLQRYAVRITMAVPTMLIAMLASPKFATTDLSKLEVIVTGGTVVAPELVREVKQRTTAEIMALMGQTEAGGTMFCTRRGDDLDRVTQSVGFPLPRSEARIVSPANETVPTGVIGEICVRTRCRMLAYYGMPEKTKEAIDAEGWLHTGDLGQMRPDGYVQVTGRLKDMIIRGGENIYPREIEDRLAEHPAVAQSAVFGLPDAKWGEQVAAAVILRPNQQATDAQLVEFLQERIARHKVPKHWFFVASLPVNASGKIQKFLLRDQFAAHSP